MTELLRLLSDDPSELEAALLRSVEGDEPGPDGLERTRAALGVSAAALAAASVSSVTSSALAAHAVAAAGNAATLAKPLTVLSLAKWLAVGIGAGLATGGVAHLASRAITPAPATLTPLAAPAVPPVTNVAHAPTGPRAVVTAEPQPAAPESAPLVTSSASFAPPAPPATPSHEPTVPMPPPALTGSASFEPVEKGAPVANGASASTLAAETKALDGVRAALAAGRAADALAALNRYRAAWPMGALRAEATLLHVEALLRSGNRAAAEREANALITQTQGSRYATRARALLDGAP